MRVHLAIFLVVTLLRKGTPTGENVNVNEYGVLCKIWRLHQGLELPDGEKTKEDGVAIVKEISDLWIVTLANESEEKDYGGKVDRELRQRVRKISDTQIRQTASARFKRVLKKARESLQALQNAIANRTEATEQAKKQLIEAMYGNGVTGEDDGEGKLTAKDAAVLGNEAAKGGTIVKNCGGTGENEANGGNVGISLANDILCLCYLRGSGYASDQKMCLDGVTGGSNNNALNSALSDLTNDWPKLKNGCPKHQGKTTTASIEASLAAFHAKLGAQANKADASHQTGRYILGIATTPNTGCNGAQNQFCVNYKRQLAGTDKGIPWERKVRGAEDKLVEADTMTRMVEMLIHRLENLNWTAWGIYEDALEHVDAHESGRIEGGSGTNAAASTYPKEKQQNAISNESPVSTSGYVGVPLGWLISASLFPILYG